MNAVLSPIISLNVLARLMFHNFAMPNIRFTPMSRLSLVIARLLFLGDGGEA